MRRNSRLAESAYRSVSQLARSFTQLMREQLAGGPITVQQCYTLEALVSGPKSMKVLAAEVGLHQSTLTRVVEKLEKLDLVCRRRRADDQRSVEVTVTAAGRDACALLDSESKRLCSALLDQVPKGQRRSVVAALEILARLLDPGNPAFRKLLQGCCADSPVQSGVAR